MKCLICGIEIEGNETFCANCHKPKVHSSRSNSRRYDHITDNINTSKYPLMSFSREYFMILYEIGLWLILIGSVIGFTAVFGQIGDGEGSTLAWGIFGFLIGIIVGLVIVGLSGGIVAVFLRMAEDIENIKHSQKGDI